MDGGSGLEADCLVLHLSSRSIFERNEELLAVMVAGDRKLEAGLSMTDVIRSMVLGEKEVKVMHNCQRAFCFLRRGSSYP